MGILGLSVAIADYFIGEPTSMLFLLVRIFGLIGTLISLVLYNFKKTTSGTLVYIFVGMVLFAIDNFGFTESYIFFFSAVINTINALVFFEPDEWRLKSGSGITIWAFSVIMYLVHMDYVATNPELVIESPIQKLVVQFIFIGIISILGVSFEAYTVHLSTLARKKQEELLKDTILLTKSIVHDIKQPLSQIPMINGIVSSKLPDEYRNEADYLERSTQTVLRTVRLINESQKQIENLEFFQGQTTSSVKDCLNQILPLYSDSLDALKFEGVSLSIKGDIAMSSTDMMIILRNLLSNSIKYRDPNSDLKIECRWNKETQEFRWSDNGKGVAHEVLEKLGREVFRADKRIQGSGQGLLNVASIAEKNGFNIKFEHNEPSGLCITLLRSEAFNDVSKRLSQQLPSS